MQMALPAMFTALAMREAFSETRLLPMERKIAAPAL